VLQLEIGKTTNPYSFHCTYCRDSIPGGTELNFQRVPVSRAVDKDTEEFAVVCIPCCHNLVVNANKHKIPVVTAILPGSVQAIDYRNERGAQD